MDDGAFETTIERNVLPFQVAQLNSGDLTFGSTLAGVLDLRLRCSYALSRTLDPGLSVSVAVSLLGHRAAARHRDRHG